MRGLSLTQPWATLVASGAKTIETRSWPTNYRGPIAIHATKNFPQEARDLCFTEPFFAALDGAGLLRWYVEMGGTRWEHRLPLGAIVAVATLAGCAPAWRVGNLPEWRRRAPHEEAFGDYSGDRYAWLLADVRPLSEPVPCRGALGLWAVPPDIIRPIKERLA